MQLTEELKEKINKLISSISLSELIKESERLTFQYRNKTNFGPINALSSDKQRLAYLAARLPATYVVGYKVLSELKTRAHVDIASLLDIGAGPGTLLMAAAESFISLSKATMIERDAGFIQIGKQLCSELELDQNWICHDFKKKFNTDPHDLVIASYSLNELQREDLSQVLNRLWKLTKKFLVIIEPGTKAAFESLKMMRQHLLSLGGFLIAPCPHSFECPLKENDWCHFAARIERSSLHRKVKDATLNYEDEKFSYLIFSKENIAPCSSRILRRPYKGTGFIKLQLCSKTSAEEKIITKKNKQIFSYSKKLEWGDEFK